MNDDSVAFGTLHLRLLWALFLLTSVSGAAAVMDFFADEFEASLVASRRGFAGDQGLSFAAARVNATSNVVFARFADVGVVISAWFVFILGAAAFVDFLYSIDGGGHGASFLVLAGLLHASRNDRFALFAEDQFAFAALVLLALFAVSFLRLADPLLASAIRLLVGLNGLLAVVAVQLLFGLLFGHASVSFHADFLWKWVWFAIFSDDVDGGDGEFVTLVAFRRRRSCCGQFLWHAAKFGVAWRLFGSCGALYRYKALSTRFRWRNGFDAVVLHAIAVIAVLDGDVALTARLRRWASFRVAFSRVKTGAVNILVPGILLALGTFLSWDQTSDDLSDWLPWSDLFPLPVLRVLFAQEFFNLDGDGRLFIGLREILGSFHDNFLDEPDVGIVHLHVDLFDDAYVLADFVHAHESLLFIGQFAGGDFNHAFLQFGVGIIDLLGGASARDLDSRLGPCHRNTIFVAVGQLRVFGQSRALGISSFHFHRV